MKILKARVNNLESNLHIEIDMERLEDSSKALSFIGIEVSDALKLIPTPEASHVQEEVQENQIASTELISDKVDEKTINHENIETEKVKLADMAAQENDTLQEIEDYTEQTTFKTKTSLWQKIKNSKLVRAATYVFRIRIRIELPSNALPEGRGENL